MLFGLDVELVAAELHGLPVHALFTHDPNAQLLSYSQPFLDDNDLFDAGDDEDITLFTRSGRAVDVLIDRDAIDLDVLVPHRRFDDFFSGYYASPHAELSLGCWAHINSYALFDDRNRYFTIGKDLEVCPPAREPVTTLGIVLE